MARRRPPTRNNALADRIRKYQARIFRFSTGVSDQIQERITGVRADLVRILAQGDPTEPTRLGDRINRVDAVTAEASRVIANRYRGVNTITTNALTNAADVDQSIMAQLIERTTGDRGITTLPARQLERIVDRALIDGAPSSDWWRRQAAGVVQRYHDQILRGMQMGESIGTLIQRVRGTAAAKYEDGVLAVPLHQAEALIRSSILSATNDVRAAEFAENADVVRGRAVVTTFDSRTCSVCMSFSGAAYDHEGNPLPDSPVQIPLPSDGLPIHWQCRCTWAAVLVEEKPPDDLSFEDWLEEQPEAEQQEILGEQWWSAWKAGELTSLRDRIDQRGRPITLKQLRGEKETEAA